MKIDTNKVVTTIADGFEKGLDGVVMVTGKEFIISNYQGMLWYIKADGTKQLLLNTRAGHIMSNDISYNSTTKILYVPSFGTKRIIAYRVK